MLQTLSDPLPHYDRSASDHPEFYYDPRTGRYHYKDNKNFISKEARENLTRGHIQNVKDRLQSAADTVQKISFPRWQKQAFGDIKIAHTQSYILGRGGIHRMESEDYATLTKEMRFQRDYFKRLSQQIKSGELTIAQLRHRLGMYAKAVRVSHEDGLLAAAIADGFTHERNILNAGESCPECKAISRKGWHKIGTSKRPGRRQCLFECKCFMERRRLR